MTRNRSRGDRGTERSNSAANRTALTHSGPYQIGHLFADYGVESEVLSALGHVTRVTIDPEPNPFIDETIQMDLMEQEPDLDLDLAVLHPSCADECNAVSITGDADDHENQIPRAREIARSIAEDYCIENVPRDDLHDPTVLTGKMYGLPLKYARAFEASFPIQTPPRERRLGEKTVTPYYYADRSQEWWLSIKGYRGDYPKEHLCKNAVPSVYVQTIVRSWLEARNERDGETPQDNNTRAPPTVTETQAELGEVGAR